MPKRFLTRLALSPQKLREYRLLRALGEWIYEPNLWHINRHSAASAFAIGLFCAMLPIPGQMVVAAIFALVFRANMPISVSLVFITNPFTMPIIFYGAYELGVVLLGMEPTIEAFHLSWEWLRHSLNDIWLPLTLGSLVMGIVLGAAGWIAIQWLWRLRIQRLWLARSLRRRR